MALEASPHLSPHRLAAQISSEETYVFFFNSTQRQVNVYWMNFNGRQDLFTTLKPEAGIMANTFVTHPWIFRDFITGERMHVKHQDVFWPQLYRVRDPQNVSQWIPCRKLIAIHQPVQSLRSKCLWRFAQLIFGCDSAILMSLSVPRTVDCDLRLILKLIEKHRKIGLRRS